MCNCNSTMSRSQNIVASRKNIGPTLRLALSSIQDTECSQLCSEGMWTYPYGMIYESFCLSSFFSERDNVGCYISVFGIWRHLSWFFQRTHISVDYGLNDRGSRVRFPVGAWNFSLHNRVQNGSGTHLASHPVGTRGSFPGREADHSRPSSAEVKNAWSYTSTPPIRLHGVVLS
jgi:hypothetical protein